MPPKKTSTTPVTSLTHHDKRANIPTEELHDFVADQEKEPKAVLYPRDPSLDPQLVWKGKDEQDQHPLEVPAVPVYIQEKISPQAIIENVRAAAKKGQSDQQLTLFADFNNITFQDLVDFYHHEQNWSNRMILGDSLLVMTSLAEKEGLKGRVQMIYLDPPYGIKFGSNWQVSTRKRDVKDGKEEDLTRQPEQIKAFRDTWELGIHSYLAYLRDRLTVARELLTDSGSVFVQIGDENVHLVRNVLDEIFGSENFVAIIPFRKKTMPFGTNFIEQMADFLIWYAKEKFTPSGSVQAKYRPLSIPQEVEGEFHHVWYELPDGTRHRMTPDQLNNHKLLPDKARVFRLKSLEPSGPMKSGLFDYDFQGKVYHHPKNGYGSPPKGMDRLNLANRIQPEGNRLNTILFADENVTASLTAPWFDTVGADDKSYVVQTNSEVIKRCMLMTTDPGDLVLDPTCGSGTTAYVAEQWGRRWITIDTSRVAIALARTRLMAGRFPYYLLGDSAEGIKKEAGLNGQLPPQPLPPTGSDVKRGFVYKRVPHITLKSIANNEEIDAIREKFQPQLESLRAELSRLTGQNWQDYEIPHDLPAPFKQQSDILALHSQWWTMRRERQKEIDASIARRADTELLYDQPYEENKKVRVSGPFTVESLSPHRVLSTDQERPASEQAGQNLAAASGGFEALIIENLRTAGVQNTKKAERLKFNRLEPYAGTWLHAVGEYQEKDGTTRRATVCIGPEHGTVGPDLIKDAAKEAVQGIGFDLLVVLGFAFDPHVAQEAREYGRLTVLPARINPDLQMGDHLLKKSGAGNLFTVYGEPDLEIKTLPDGKLTVTIKGVDIFDPTTGEIRSSSTDEIACWFIDTDYNGESFFVRHAYFTGADEPYEKLKRALRADIDEAAWSALYATTSYAFDRPKTGKMAVKVINHYGDEVLKVYKI